METSNAHTAQFLKLLFGRLPIAEHLQLPQGDVMEVGQFEITKETLKPLLLQNDTALDFLIEHSNTKLAKRRSRLFRFQRAIPLALQEDFKADFASRLKTLEPILTISQKRTQYLSHIPAQDEKKDSLSQFEAKIALYKAELLPKILATFFFKRHFKTQFPFSERERHTYILGGSGSGKTEFIKLFVYSDILQKKGCLIIDPHGDLVDDLSRFKAKDKDIIYLTGTFGKLGYYFKLNPFDHEHHDSPEHIKQGFVSVKAQELLNAFTIVMQTEFTGNMSRMIFNILQVLLRHKGMNLNDFMRALRPATSTPYERLARHHPLESVRLYFAHDFNLKTLSITKQSVLTRFENALANYHLFQIFDCKESSFHLKKALNTGKCILVNASQGLFGEQGARMLGSFLVSELTTLALQRADIPEKFRKPWMVYIDEFQNFLTPRISKMLSETRKYGLHLTLANQYLNQIDSPLRSGILSNTQIKCLGYSSAKDFEVMSKELGLKNKTIPKLGKGRFVVKVGSYDPIVIQAYSFLVNTKGPNYLASKAHRQRLNWQLGHYYQKTLSKAEKAEQETTQKKSAPLLLPSIEKLL